MVKDAYVCHVGLLPHNTTNIVKIINDFVNKAIEIEKTQISISETSEIFDDVGEESEIDVDSDNRSGNEDEDEYISDGFDELDYDIDESDFDDDEDEDDEDED